MGPFPVPGGNVTAPRENLNGLAVQSGHQDRRMGKAHGVHLDRFPRVHGGKNEKVLKIIEIFCGSHRHYGIK